MRYMIQVTMSYDGKYFKRRSKVYVIKIGELCVKVTKRGFVYEWVHWRTKDKPFPQMDLVLVTDEFYNKVMRIKTKRMA